MKLDYKYLVGNRTVTYFGFGFLIILKRSLLDCTLNNLDFGSFNASTHHLPTFWIHILYEAGSCFNHLIVMVQVFPSKPLRIAPERTIFRSLGISWWKMFMRGSFCSCSGLPTVVEIALALLLTTRCATQRSALALTRTSVLSSASRGATNTTKTSSTPGYRMSTQMVSL